MKNFKFKLAMIFAIGFIVSMTSCKKDETSSPESADTSATEYDALAEGIFTDVGNITDEAYGLGNGSLKSTEDDDGRIIGPCATITLDTTVFPRVLTIDFGEENCLCLDGRYRRGKIIKTFSGRYFQPGTIHTVGFEDYYVNDHHVEGSRIVTNMGYNDDENMYWTVVVEAMITIPSENAETEGVTFGWNASRTREWVEGDDTYIRWDDVYLHSGSSDGVRPSGATWTKEIIIPLRRELSCRFLVSGSIEIAPEDKPVRLLDYGNGDCDNIATVTVDGQTYTIYLR